MLIYIWLINLFFFSLLYPRPETSADRYLVLTFRSCNDTTASFNSGTSCQVQIENQLFPFFRSKVLPSPSVNTSCVFKNAPLHDKRPSETPHVTLLSFWKSDYTLFPIQCFNKSFLEQARDHHQLTKSNHLQNKMSLSDRTTIVRMMLKISDQ